MPAAYSHRDEHLHESVGMLGCLFQGCVRVCAAIRLVPLLNFIPTTLNPPSMSVSNVTVVSRAAGSPTRAGTYTLTHIRMLECTQYVRARLALHLCLFLYITETHIHNENFAKKEDSNRFNNDSGTCQRKSQRSTIIPSFIKLFSFIQNLNVFLNN